MTEPQDALDKEQAVEQATADLQSNDIAGFIMATIHDSPSKEPRTLQGEFPGSKTRAMGHALEVVELAAEHGIDAEREYIGEMDDYDLHRIDIHIEGGSGSSGPLTDNTGDDTENQGVDR